MNEALGRAPAAALFLWTTACTADQLLAVGGGGEASGGGEGGEACGLIATACEEGDDVFTALGLHCPGGVAVESAEILAEDPASLAVVHEYGNAYWAPRDGDKALVLTTGVLPAVGAAGEIVRPEGAGRTGGDNLNPDGAELPEPVRTTPASPTPFVDCDGVGDCSGTLDAVWSGPAAAHDLVGLRFTVEVPPAAGGWALDVAWLSAELPPRAAGPDLLVVWSDGAAYTGNAAYLDGRAVVPATMAAHVLDAGTFGTHPAVLQTGFFGETTEPCALADVELDRCPLGGASGWWTVRGPAIAGERLSIAIALLDLGDATIDTTVVLDRFRFTCGCTLPGGCGMTPS